MSGWVPISGQRARDWRRESRQRVADRGGRLESTVHRTPGLAPVDYEAGDTAGMERPAPAKPQEGRQTVEAMTKDILEWARSDPDRLLARVRLIKSAGAMQHLTDEQAADQLVSLAEKLARDSAERVYAANRWNKGVRIGGG